MCTALEEMIKEGEQKGKRIGRRQGRRQGINEVTAYVIRNMYQKGYREEEIAEILEWPLDKVKKYIIV